MAISESNVESAIAALTAFSIQTSTEAGTSPATNTTANILHASASRKQGNFTVFLAMAEDQLAEDLIKAGKTATDAQKEKALAYLIGDLQEKKDPDFAASSVSMSGYSVSRDGQTGYMHAYKALLESLPNAADGTVSTDIEQTRDHTEYPESWRLTGLDSAVIDPF